MLSGATCKAADTAGTAVFRIVVSSDSMKKATATSHGKTRLQTSEAQGLSPTVFGSVGGFIGWQIVFAAKARQVSAYLVGSAVYLMQFCGLVSVGENRALHALRPIPDGKSAFHAQCFSDRKSTRLNSSHLGISYAVFCLDQKSTRLNSSHLGISYAVFCLNYKRTRQI